MTPELFSQSLALSLPEVILAVGALALLMIGVFAGEQSSKLVSALAIVLLIVVGLWIVFFTGNGQAYGGAFIVDPFARFMKAIAITGSVFALIMSIGQGKAMQLDKFEYPVLLAISTLGMLLLISANDLIAFYLGLELMSLSLYVVAAFNRDSLRSTEAGLKYFVLGALSSGMLLYGMSLVYGFTGNTGFDGIANVLMSEKRSLGLVFGMVFMLAGACFKISAVPFHMWTPDVYEGAPTPVTAFFAAGPKVAAMAILIRLTSDVFLPIIGDWRQIIVFVSIASMLLGSFAAVAQTNIKRLMAYSSIGHMGYALVGLAAGSESGVSGIVVYMLIYVAMSVGTFACIISMRRPDGTYVENTDDLAGLWASKPFMTMVLTAQMFSMAGIPPLAGFFAKYFVFLAAAEAKLYALAVIGFLTSVVGAYYYLRIVKLMWFDPPKGEFARTPGEIRFVFGISALFILVYILFGGPIGQAADAAARSFF
ncbi:NADH-quinone oxidoreductase subunit NuoN [Neorhizobium sp. NCHU2750]|uniref:NADH-quinone oxidoreductase subunit NuoN n=1 Tax=Neorhizobium sp. NCHU2750 TaxID=1825976 RepID=UPI000E73456F|nr:NADH-quinone oxidoreductase subunit N [Neorhizobium sp. NCHU2750]